MFCEINTMQELASYYEPAFNLQKESVAAVQATSKSNDTKSPIAATDSLNFEPEMAELQQSFAI